MSDIIFQELDGKQVAYHSDTEFLVQVGHNRSQYKTKYVVRGNLTKAVFLYNAINVGRGYKKRLLAPSMNNKTLAKMLT